MSGVVVAGAGGYVGGRLVAELAGRATPVTALVRRHRRWLDRPGVVQVAVDLLEGRNELPRLLDGADALVHLAGPSEVVAARDPGGVLADTTAITAALAGAATAAGVRRVVYLSTIHVYGARVEPGAVLHEGLRPEPRHPYAIARLACEHLLAAAPVESVSLRLTNSVGAPADPAVDRWTLVVNDLCRQVALHGELRLHSDGQQWRDFVPLGDAARAIADVAAGRGRPGTWNLGSGSSRTVRSAAEAVADAAEAATGRRPPLHAPAQAGPPGPAHVVDVGALAADGITCTSALEPAVAEVLDLCLRHPDELPGDGWGAPRPTPPEEEPTHR